MKTLNDIENLKSVKVLVRVDFNVPIRNGTVADDTRLKAAMPTIDFLRAKGAKIILASHLESNDGSIPSLQPVADYLKAKLDLPVMFVENIRTARDLIENELQESQCLMIENLRSFDGEKADDQGFAKELASLADISVNEAFSVCHRKHASIVSVPKYIPSYAGFELEKEVANLSKVFNPAHPFLFILGGAKFETKLPLLSKFIGIADTVFVGGALASDFFKIKGYEVGQSKVSDLGDSPQHPSVDGADMANDLKKYADNPKLLLPIDVTLKDKTVKSPDSLAPDDAIADSGPKTVAMLGEKISSSKFILWNGPLGMYEDGYREPTLDLAKMIGEATARGAETIVGGGDTLAAIASLGITDKFSFVSTAGGAMLDFLAKGTLPGIQALEDSDV